MFLKKSKNHQNSFSKNLIFTKGKFQFFAENRSIFFFKINFRHEKNIFFVSIFCYHKVFEKIFPTQLTRTPGSTCGWSYVFFSISKVQKTQKAHILLRVLLRPFGLQWGDVVYQIWIQNPTNYLPQICWFLKDRAWHNPDGRTHGRTYGRTNIVFWPSLHKSPFGAITFSRF